MANSAINMNAAGNGYLGQPAGAVAAGQIYSNGTPGPLSSVLSGIGTSTADGASSTITLNFIDGTQSLAQFPVVVNLQSITTAATINGVANQAIISGVGAMGQFKVGQTITTAGFATSANNAASVITQVGASTLQVTNASAVAETNFSATGTVILGQRVAAVRATRSALSFAGVADTATAVGGPISVSAITNKACTITLSGNPGAGSCSILFDVYFAS